MKFLIVTSAIATALSQSLVFSPASLSLKVADGNFTVALSSAPTGDFPVTFYQDGFQFSKCSLLFTKDNWNQPQQVSVVVPPSFSAGTASVNVPFQLCGTSKTTQNYQISPASFKLETCISKGDPHYSPFKGDSFDYQGNGSYYLYHSDNLDIVSSALIQQTFLCQIPGTSGKFTWNCKVGIRYASTAYVFLLSNDQINATLVRGTLETSPIQVYQTDKNAQAYEIDLPSNSGKIVLTKGRGFNIQATLCPSQYPLTGATSASGLCFGKDNLVPVPANNDLFLGNCAVTPLPLVNSFLTCPSSPSCPVISNPTNTTITPPPKNETYVPPPPPGCIPLKQCPKYDVNVAVSLTCPAFKPIDYSVALQRCSAIVVDLKVGSVKLDFFVKSCADDYSTTGDTYYLESSRVSYTAGCHSHVQYGIQNSYDPAQRQEYQKIADNSGFGNATCNNDCGSNGYCGAVGCECNTGYGGSKCEYDLNQPQTIKASSAVKLSAAAFVMLAMFL